MFALETTDLVDSDLVNAIRFAMQATKRCSRFEGCGYKDAVKSLGAEFGHRVAKSVAAENSIALAEKLSSFWVKHDLGDMRVLPAQSLLIEIRNCYDCIGRNFGGTATTCTFKEGFLKSVFEDVLDYPFTAEELECCGVLAPACKFEVKAAGLRVDSPIRWPQSQ